METLTLALSASLLMPYVAFHVASSTRAFAAKVADRVMMKNLKAAQIFMSDDIIMEIVQGSYVSMCIAALQYVVQKPKTMVGFCS